MPEKYYPDKFYPTFLKGNFYIMVGNIIPSLLKTIDEYDGYVIFIDDTFITGIIAEKAGIKRFKYKLIKAIGCHHNQDCIFCNAVARVQCTESKRRLQLWSQFKNSKESHKEVHNWPKPYRRALKNGESLNSSEILIWFLIVSIVVLIIIAITIVSYNCYELFE